jgi:DamX protein
VDNTTSNDNSPPPYLAFYGLSREPFGRAIEDDLFYPEATRKQRLDLLLHLTQYGKELLLVTGPEGSGKSALLSQFAAKALASWSVARLDAQGGLDERKLIQQLYRRFQLDFQGASHGELLEHLTHHLDGLVHSARQGVMLVDNAHCLPVTALQRVLEFASLSNKGGKPLLRVILFGEAELEHKLNDPLLERYRDCAHRNLDLPPFNEEDSVQYLLHRLSMARFAGTEPFTDAALKKLYKQSGGWPGRLNQLAHKLLLGALPAGHAAPQLAVEGKRYRRPGQLIAGGLALALIAGILLFQDTINQYFRPTPPAQVRQTLPLPPAAPPTAPAPPPTETATEPPPPTIAVEKTTEAAKPTLDDTFTKLVENHLPTPEAAKAAAPPAAATPLPTPHAKAAKSPASTPAVKMKTPPSAMAKDTKPAAPQMPAVAASGLPNRREAWLRQQDPSHYTLQLVAGTREETIEKFIRQHHLHDRLALYQTTRNGKPWYGLVYGIYPNKQAAIDARSQLPPKLRRVQPWVRPLADIQKTLP